MAGLQRSAVSFRRQGSSGLVWDDKFLSAELNHHADQHKITDDAPQSEDGAARNPSPLTGLAIERSRSNGGRGFRTGRVSPAVEPPSPRVSACCFCTALAKDNNTRRRPPKSAKRVV
ncbi:MAPK kinase substrate protein At1g80180 [Andrographis paniculata]|uniref:MAPK kinase substrate protein At1g80180 n=1 Tax=Andrographis paniculata TaxID=175694 RepID=UPI0021E83899|nr:MAPK kinase substrate protein At1g80180 [Andrographis paniculata]